MTDMTPVSGDCSNATQFAFSLVPFEHLAHIHPVDAVLNQYRERSGDFVGKHPPSTLKAPWRRFGDKN